MSEILIQEFKKETTVILGNLKREVATIRTNRPSPVLVEDIRVDYYGKKMPLNQVGSVGIELPRDIIIHVWDKAAIPEVMKAIEASARGLSAAPQGNVIRVHLPELSEERRAELVKLVKRVIEDNRIQIRHFRDETNKKIQRADNLSEDQKFKLKGLIQEETEKINKEIEFLLEGKVKEINE